ncbi:hypothetical protein KI688_003462 [Linnemannia hyalina]|uniref:Crinkler effector protein N-terminal domain-containing protein n=1 Tax=Linnemannia hyalina TaxID=64524 RepID=A0A9P7XQS3_9FUNG|nr:hypothetical protein KI688_003462 [Linnemannia hyalina]
MASWRHGVKKLIKSEKSPRIDDVAADELTLWRVSVPITEDNDKIPIQLDNVTNNDRKKLGPVTHLWRGLSSAASLAHG